MSRNQQPWEDDDIDESGEQDNPMKQMRAYIKKLEKERDELRTENDTLKPQLRTRSVVDILTAKGVKAPSKVAKLVPQDVDATDEAVAEWLADYSDVLGIEQAPEADGQATADGQTTTPEGQQSTLNDEQIAQLRQMDSTQNTALPAELQRNIEAALADPNLTEEGLLKLIANPTAV